MKFDIRVGLPKPEKGKDGFNTLDFNALRRAIDDGSRDSALIYRCLNVASAGGLSGEDKYTLLAYQALLLLEEYHQRVLEFYAAMPAPPLAASASDNGRGNE